MHRLIITCEVKDADKWEQSMLNNPGTARAQTVTTLHFTVTDQNKAIVYIEVDDLAIFFDDLRSQQRVEELELQGMKRETVEVFILDKSLDLGTS